VNKLKDLQVVKVFGVKVTEVVMPILRKFPEEMEETTIHVGLFQELLSNIPANSDLMLVKKDIVLHLQDVTKTQESRS